MSTFRCHVIVLHWGDPSITAACLASLRAEADAQTRVLVVDNGTPDRSGDALARDFPEFEHLRSEENLGFAGGNNLGLRRALDEGAEFALLLNNDAEVKPGAIRALVAAADANPRLGFINPKILYHDPPGMIWYAGGTHSLWTGRAHHVGRGAMDRGQFDRPGPVSFVTGCALLARGAMLEEIGLLDESLFMYAEDLDWGLRAQRAGWTLWHEPRAVVIHRDPVLKRKTVADAFRLRLATRNTLRVNWRHGRPWQRATCAPWFMLRWAAFLTVKNLALGFPGDAWAVWRGVGDAIAGRTGRPEAERR